MKLKEKNTAIFSAYDDLPPYDPAEPEKNLALAILNSAIADLKKTNSKEAESAREFFLNTDSNYIFSFQAICEHLNVDPKKVLLITGLLDLDNEEKNTPTATLNKTHIKNCHK